MRLPSFGAMRFAYCALRGLQQVADAFGVHYSTGSRALVREQNAIMLDLTPYFGGGGDADTLGYYD